MNRTAGSGHAIKGQSQLTENWNFMLFSLNIEHSKENNAAVLNKFYSGGENLRGMLSSRISQTTP